MFTAHDRNSDNSGQSSKRTPSLKADKSEPRAPGRKIKQRTAFSPCSTGNPLNKNKLVSPTELDPKTTTRPAGLSRKLRSEALKESNCSSEWFTGVKSESNYPPKQAKTLASAPKLNRQCSVHSLWHPQNNYPLSRLKRQT